MNFDHTYIAIRKRNVLEIFDLALLVIRDHFRPLLILWLAGTVPFFIANAIAIRWMTVDVFDTELLTLYFWIMAVLVSNQAQVATTFMTNYLGQAIFSQRPGVAMTIRSTLGVSPYFLWVHGILRMVAPVLLTVSLLHTESNADNFGGTCFLLLCLATVGLVVRCARPFASEILLLEKTPIRGSSKANGRNQINYSLRSSSLHRAASSELIGRFMLMSLLVLSNQGRLGQQNAETVEIVGLYWHFVDIVWIVIFTLIYLFP